MKTNHNNSSESFSRMTSIQTGRNVAVCCIFCIRHSSKASGQRKISFLVQFSLNLVKVLSRTDLCHLWAIKWVLVVLARSDLMLGQEREQTQGHKRGLIGIFLRTSENHSKAIYIFYPRSWHILPLRSLSSWNHLVW